MMLLMMLSASMAVLTACSADDPFDTTNNNIYNPGDPNMGGGMGGNGSSTAGSGELLNFSVDLDRKTTEPASTVAAYYPEAEDDISQQTFATQVTIDMSNPVAKTENGIPLQLKLWSLAG